MSKGDTSEELYAMDASCRSSMNSTHIISEN